MKFINVKTYEELSHKAALLIAATMHPSTISPRSAPPAPPTAH